MDVFPNIDKCQRYDFKRRHESPESILVGADREGLLFMVHSIKCALDSLYSKLEELKKTIDVTKDLYRLLGNPLGSKDQENNSGDTP